MRILFCLLFILLSIDIIIYQAVSMNIDGNCLKMHRRTYSNVMMKDGEFRILIRDMRGKMADRFEPGQEYKVIINNAMYGMDFKEYSLFISYEMEDSMPMENNTMISFDGLGNFVISRKFGIVDYACPNRIHSHYNSFLTYVEAIWQAPLNPMKCVRFDGQIVKADSMIYESTGSLVKVFCPTKLFKMMIEEEKKLKLSQPSPDEMAPMVKECCACGVASYNVTFVGLWSMKTHPKDWPQQKSMLHWTNLVGATHTGNYFIYYNGGQASQAVQSICSYGDNTVLRQQFNEEAIKPHLKSYFNTTGMWNEDEIESSRSGYISVNRTHHLFSFLTMMGPSPDWCTGIVAVDLCMQDCTWKENFTMDLFPFDAGIKNGFTYIPENSDRQDIPDPIRIINTTIMAKYPFTPNVPVGRVHFQRIKPKHSWECTKMAANEVNEFDSLNSVKNANSQFEGSSLTKKRRIINKKNPLDDPTLANMATFLCITSQWSDWSRCSVTCGIGTEMRSREMLKNAKAELCRHLPLHESRTCEGRKRACDFSAPCSLLSWSRWGPCNATCDNSGYQQRARMFARNEEKSKCLMKKKFKTLEYKMCKKDTALCDPVIICSEGLVMGSICGKPMTNYFYDASKHLCTPFKYLGCKGSLNNFPTKMACEKTCLEAVNALPQWRKDKMAHLQFQSQSSSDKRKKMPTMADQCRLEVKYGGMYCSSLKYEIRYYYDNRNGRCRQFTFTGCNGNSNNFPTYHGCIKACVPDQIEFMKTAPIKPCLVSEWSHWGPCSSLCGAGEKTKWRSVVKPALNGGPPCPELYMSEPCFGSFC